MSPSVETVDHASEALQRLLRARLAAADAWLPFDAFMHDALYAPGLGYYASGRAVLGRSAADGSDFVTAPELSPAFGHSVARQVAQWFELGLAPSVLELGAGSGALMLQIVKHKTSEIRRHSADILSKTPRYRVLEVSGSLKERQAQAWAKAQPNSAWNVAWLDRLPERIEGVVLGNEVLDAMPVKLLQRSGGVWHERGVVWAGDEEADGQGGWRFEDRPTRARPPTAVEGEGDYLTEIHPQAEAFIATLAAAMQAGKGAVALFIDYGFNEAEYYHPQRHMGTLVAHRAHRVDVDVLRAVGQQDITAHVNFTGIAVAGQSAGLDVLGFTTQARFLMNCGILAELESATLAQRANAQKLLTEHEMGTLFKVIALCTPNLTQTLLGSIGFAQGDLTHRL